jgi:hypothetical protein
MLPRMLGLMTMNDSPFDSIYFTPNHDKAEKKKDRVNLGPFHQDKVTY